MTYWAIKAPNGNLWHSTFFYRKDAQFYAEKEMFSNWYKMYRKGYRCVKVKIVEVDE